MSKSRIPIIGAEEIAVFQERVAALREQHKTLAADLSAFLQKQGCMRSAGEVLVDGSVACGTYHRAIQAYIGRGFTVRDEQ